MALKNAGSGITPSSFISSAITAPAPKVRKGPISELLAQNNISNTVDQQLAALDKIGGLDALGTHKTDNMYHASWAWAGDTPFRSTKLVAAHFGGTRNPMVISWPKGIKPDKVMRSQFSHVVDIVPTVRDEFAWRRPSFWLLLIVESTHSERFSPEGSATSNSADTPSQSAAF
jgi:arylsulfatase A-like enzyme